MAGGKVEILRAHLSGTGTRHSGDTAQVNGINRRSSVRCGPLHSRLRSDALRRMPFFRMQAIRCTSTLGGRGHARQPERKLRCPLTTGGARHGPVKGPR